MESFDRLFDLLSDERRRYALYYLEQQDGPVSLDETVEQVAEWETETEVVPEEKFDDVKIDLFHTDLPKASEVDYIHFDREKGVVEIVGEPPEFNAIASFAEVIERPDRNP